VAVGVGEGLGVGEGVVVGTGVGVGVIWASACMLMYVQIDNEIRNTVIMI
jgi:hypothetical protein